jgi:iron complex outermembrane receptor protein
MNTFTNRAAMTLAAAGMLYAGATFAASDTSLEEIVVTAQKREQKYTDVPVAVSTLSGETLDLAKITEFQDLVQMSPSMTYNQTGDMRGVGVLVRGIGTTAFQTAVEPTVSNVVDGVSIARTVQFISDLNDIERVEILRGPQGTLFGKNSTGGVVNIVTKRPSEEAEGSVKVTASDDNAWTASVSASGPLSDNMRGRVSFFSKKYDGWAKNAFTGNDINGDESWGVRGKLDIDISDDVNLYLIADVSEQDRNCCSFILSSLGANPNVAWDYESRGITVNEKNVITLDAQDGFSNTETSGLSAELTVDLDNWVLTSITAWRGFNLQTNQGVDTLPYDEPTPGRFLFNTNGAFDSGVGPGGDQEQKQISEELRLTSTGFENATVTLGLFYWDQSVDRYFEREALFCLAGTDPNGSPDPAINQCAKNEDGSYVFSLYGASWFYSTVETKNWAAFGQVDYAFNDRMRASVGLRYTNDDIYLNFIRDGVAGPAVPGPHPYFETGTDESDVTGKVALMFDVADSSMVYASYATGYKSPAYDLIFGSTAATLADPVPPETVGSFELGLKGEYFDNSLRLGVTAFRTEFKDLQGQTTVVNPNGDIRFALFSAGVALTQGVEIDFTAKPTANLLLNGGVAFIDATFDEYKTAQCYPGQTEAQGCVGGSQDLSGKQINNAPKRKLAVQARYDIPLAGSFDAYLTGTYRWQSESPSELNGNPATYRDSYGVLDLGFGIDSKDGAWSANIYAKNALDDFYQDQEFDFGGIAGAGAKAAYLTRDAWRYIGVEVSYNFGAK